MKLRDDPGAKIGANEYQLHGADFERFKNTEFARRAGCGDPATSIAVDALVFTCPADGCMLRVPFTRGPAFELRDHTGGDEPVHIWQATGEFPDTLSLSPSVHVKDGPKDAQTTHWHGRITNGEAA